MSTLIKRIVVLATLASIGSMARGQDARPAPAAESPDEVRERRVIERFLSLLEKTPRRGTALDRVYGYHIERGNLDAFLKTYRDRVVKDPKDGKSWLLLGLFEAQRGKDAAAVEAFRHAEETRPDDPLPPYYLGQALVLVGQPESAAEAFERAIARKPARNDLLEIFQALGRVYQRGHKTEQALSVWNRLEQLFPDDLRVQEQIAETLAEESQPAQALPRFEGLAKKTRDAYRKTQFLIEAADLKVRLGRSSDALADFERLLGDLNPESWLHREVRRRIEEVFLRNDDQAGLAKYYEAWLKKNPEDVDAMARLGRTLAGQGRVAEAQRWFDQAVKLAPGRKELRQALIEQLVQDKKYAEAAKQYEAMARTDPANPDLLRDWGRLLLRDPSRPEPERKKAAAAVWNRLVEARPKDAATAVQVADLVRQASMVDEAIALYKKAVDLDPGSPQYREYLGEYYHSLKRSSEALATWRAMAEGAQRNAKNLGRLAEVLNGFGYKTEALDAAAEACKLAPDDFELHLKYADYLFDAERFAETRTQLELAARQAADADQAEAVLDRQIKTDQADKQLANRVAELRKRIEAGQSGDVELWRRLARYLEAEGKLPEATAAVLEALKRDEQSVPVWVVAARLAESAGDLKRAADAYRRLAQIDRRSRTDYLTSVARLESRLGRTDRALEAGRDLLAAAPGNLENYQFFAELCLQLGQTDEGLEVLRRAVRLNEGDAKAVLALAETLAQQFRTDEAIEMFWRAFDKATDLDEKLGIVQRLTSLYLQQNQFDRLIARLEREGREADRQRETTFCLAQAHASSGDFMTARQDLERLLGSSSRDTQLLQQLSQLAENEGDFAAAAKYQRQLVDMAPGEEASARLAQLYMRSDDLSEAEAIWSRLAAGDSRSHQVMLALDSLATHGKRESVVTITEDLLRKQPANWELLYRQGAAFAGLERFAEAAQRFEAILSLKLSDDEKSTIARFRQRSTPGRLAGTPASSAQTMAQLNPVQYRLTASNSIRIVTGLETRYSYANTFSWTPQDFGQARMAALAWLYAIGLKTDHAETLADRFRQARARPSADLRTHWDDFYLQVTRMDGADRFEAARALAKAAPNDLSAIWALTYALPGRTDTEARRGVTPGADGVPPLPADELDQVLAAFRTLRTRRPEWISSYLASSVHTELKRAKRKDEEQQFVQEMIASATTASAAQSALSLAAEHSDVDTVLKLFETFERLKGARYVTSAVLGAGGYYVAPTTGPASLASAMFWRSSAKAQPDVLRILDFYLGFIQRPDQIAERHRSRNNTMSPAGRAAQISIWTQKNPRNITIDYPAPNAYLDLGALQILREAFEIYKRDDLLSDLFAHLEAKLKASQSDTEQIYAHLALSALRWWSDEKDEAIKELSQAARIAGSDPELLLSLAEVQALRNEPAEALAVVDSFEPLDQRTMQRRELLALRLAVLTGDVDRARRASERLFGLRLDSETQVQLADQMHQLGMHELSEAVLSRARRRAGNNSAALASLMREYQRQNKMDQAVQVAHQLLRRPNVRQVNVYSELDVYQREAIQVLARSGKLNETIKRLEGQVERSPNAVQLLEMLASYYQAAGDKAKVRATYERIGQARPDDARLRFQIGLQLYRTGEAASAVEHFKAAIRKDPSLLGYNYYEVRPAFEQAKKMDDLLDLLEQVDLSAMRQTWYITQMIQEILRDPKKHDRGLALFRKLWKSFPDAMQRQNLIANLNQGEIGQLPELYDYLTEMVLPAKESTAVAPWQGIDQIILWMGQGKIATAGTRLLDTAAGQGKLKRLCDDLQQTLNRFPTWYGGKALLAFAEGRRGRSEAAERILRELWDGRKDHPIPGPTLTMMGQEMAAIPGLEDRAQSFFETALHDDGSELDIELDFNPIQQLLAIYKRKGLNETARRELLRFYRRPDERYRFDPSYAAYQHIQAVNSVGRQLLDLGYPADAARVYSELLADPDVFETAARFGGMREEQIRGGLTQALGGLDRKALPTTLKSLLRPAESTRPDQPAIDLVLLVYPNALEQARVISLLGAALQGASGDRELLDQARAALEDLGAKHPRDMAVRIADSLLAFTQGEPSVLRARLDGLVNLVEATPLEDLSTGARANARQRAQAARQLAIWVVARECEKKAELQAAGRLLARRAIEAARRQSDTLWALAMLREQGELALERGDRQGAEDDWSGMLELILASPAQPKPSTSAVVASTPVATPPQAKVSPAPAPKRGEPAPRRVGGVPIITLDRFQRVAELARMAARKRMVALSLRAMRLSLRCGPPVQPIAMPRNNAQVVVIRSNVVQQPAASPADQAVESALGELSPLWQTHNAPAADVYEVLREAVLPSARPDEAFLFPHTLLGADKSPRSVGALLVEWALRAEKLDDLRNAVEARQDKPLAAAPAQVLLVQIGLARKDSALVLSGLASLQAQLKKSALQNTAELACHAGLPALALSDVHPQAVALLEQAIKPISVGANAEPGASLLLTLARDSFANGQTDAGRKDVQEYSAVLDRAITAASSTGRNDESSRRRETALRTAYQFATAELLTDALEALGQYVDVPWGQYNYLNTQGLPNPLAIVARQLMAQPAQDRYERLKAWTLPTASRKSVRILATFAPDDVPPPVFGKFVPSGVSGGVVSLVDLLIDSARELNALDELEAAVKQAVDQKRDHAETLWLLLQIARGRAEEATPSIERNLAEWTRKPDSSEAVRYYVPAQKSFWPDYLVVRACLASPKLVELGQRLSMNFPQGFQQEAPFAMQLRRDVAAGRLVRAGLDPQAIDPPAHWLATRFAVGNVSQWGSPAGWWLVQDAHVAGLGGAEDNHLVLGTPLTGRFEIDVESFGPRPSLGYAGYLMKPDASGPTAQWQDGRYVMRPASHLADLAGKDVLRRSVAVVNSNGYNHLTIHVEPGQIRYLVNGHLFYQENDPSPTSPFLVLGMSENGSDYRRFAIKGTPEVPDEVRLSHADRLEGWVSSFYNESVPSRFDAENSTFIRSGLLGAIGTHEETDWSAKDGVIQGRRTSAPSAGSFLLSRLYYHRPMQWGESISYEFRYEPGLVMVHPTLDRLAFLLEESGVRLRWLVNGPEIDVSGLASDHAVADPSSRRGPERLPLKPGEWNSVRLSLEGRTVCLDLNGVRVFERALESTSSRQFGFFHNKAQSSCEIRKVVLRGDWPKAFSFAALTDSVTGAGEQQARARRLLMGDAILARDADWILEQARSQPADARFDLLKRWVLPSTDRPGFRLSGSFRPTFPVPTAEPRLPADGRRVETGGQLDAPAIELVASAKALGRLDELTELVQKSQVSSDVDRRGKLALMVLIHTAQGQDREAGRALRDLKPLLARLSPETPEEHRWPELLATDASLARPALREAALALTHTMVVEQIQKEHRSIGELMQLHVRHVHGRAHWLALKESERAAAGTDPELPAWARVTHSQASSRGQGAPLAHWNAHGGELRHYPGHYHDFMYLRTPLEGNFEVSCELFGWREIELGYGGLVFGLGWDRKGYYVSQLGRAPTRLHLSPPLELRDQPFRLRLVVSDGTFSVYVGDRLIHERGLPPHADPWLVLHQPAGYMGGIRSLTINGQTAVPERIRLADAPELSGWLSDYYDEKPQGQFHPWEKRGSEITGQKLPDADGSKQESVLYYHRPMIEDGEFSYEFYYEPGKTLAHPALDRLVFLLEPDGVKLHWLTDAQYDRSGLAPDNIQEEAKHRRGPARLPFRLRDWNRLALKVEGDVVSIQLNEERVFERPIEATNQRFFGLFHHADETEVRVRNAVYEGRWPRELPADLGLTAPGSGARP